MFKVEVIDKTPNPQKLIYTSMHQCYCEDDAWEHVNKHLTKGEKWYGEMIIKHLLLGHRGHFGPLEGPAITFSVIGFPHCVINQARTHRIGVEWNVQSLRYTSERFLSYAEKKGKYALEDLIYLRPVGSYTDRFGDRYEYTEELRNEDLAIAEQLIFHYSKRISEDGLAPEHARSLLPFDIRQNFTVSYNVRSLMHFLDLRSKKDAQLEIQKLCELLFPHFEEWVPQLASWYKDNRWGRARLSP